MKMELLHGGNIYDENLNMESGAPLLDFSANINPLGMPDSVRRAVCGALDLAHNYPDPLCRKLRAALSAEYELPAEYFLCGNGGADLIYRLAYALRPGKALLTAPTFAEYEEALKQTGTDFCFYEMQKDFVVREDILTRMDASVDVMFLCNPNNPTGLLVDEDLLLRILKKARQCGIRLVLDECFLDFTGQPERSLVPYVEKYPHLLILKSFTKMYAMPGLRLGYCICSDKELLARMAAAGQCWGVSVPASEAGIAALKEKEYTQRAIRLVRKERIFLKSELEKLGFEVWDGQADYLFFRAPGVHDLYERLLPQRILIRRCANYRGLDDTYYRAAVKNHKENERLMQAIASVV
ncbi:MAG: threonine-phosphate decarboxylase CobD [Lachnospiraceae bacterium]|nr:threonine-phosphate decarboxylase CobD [Lachnospiraceae bacterium]